LRAGDFPQKITRSPINNSGGGIEDAAAAIVYGCERVIF
jgi:hypothetical protein